MESQYTGFYFETFLFFLIVTREERGGSGGASCVLCALKPMLALPGCKAKHYSWCPRSNRQWESSWWPHNSVPKLASRFSQLAREAQAGSSSPGLVASPCSPHWPEHRASWPHLHYWPCTLLPHKCPLCWANPWLGKDNAFYRQRCHLEGSVCYQYNSPQPKAKWPLRSGLGSS